MPLDDNGHGTHVAGIINAGMNNGIGMAGLAPGVRIMPVKVLAANNVGTYEAIAQGIIYAADNGAKIINLSLGGPSDSQTLHDAVIYAANRGVFIVAAAGNYAESAPHYPASYPETFAVSATTIDDTLWYSSNFGPAVDIAAPGENIWSTYWTAQQPNGYIALSGTSMAVPHVSALAALLLSNRPDYTPADLRQIIQQTAVDLGAAGRDDQFGYGRINVGAALLASQPYQQRVNAGDIDYVDSQGKVWAADRTFSAGGFGATGGTLGANSTAVNNTVDDLLYQRWRDNPGQYQFTVPSGVYEVTLKFAEFVVTRSSYRVMRITLENVQVESALDIYKTVGKATALDKVYQIPVTDGLLNIAFAQNGGRYAPVVSGLGVRWVSPPPTPTPTPTLTPTPTSTPTPTITPTPTPYRGSASRWAILWPLPMVRARSGLLTKPLPQGAGATALLALGRRHRCKVVNHGSGQHH